MISIRSQAAAFRRNSSEDENSGSNLTSEGENQSFQNLLPQNFSSASITSAIWLFTKSVLDEEMSTIEVLLKAAKISSLNESSD
jgi:hypothetical protein